jgi:GNAT superfamily N-acetyltransferase
MVEIVELSATEATARVDALAALLADVVAGGGSVGFMADLSPADAKDFWRETIAGIASGRTILFAAFDGGALVGTVLLHPCGKPNQPHRADVAKLLVHRNARRGGVATRLMQALEARALALGRTLLTLDTASGSDAEHFYRRRGYSRAGEIPGYTLMPDGALNGTTFYYKQLG